MRSWKRMWKDELKALPPLSDRVAGSPRPETESEVRVMPDGTLTRKKKALAFALPPAVVAVVLAAVLLCVFLLPVNKAAERFVLMLEINPAVAVVTDADGTVTDVAAANADAATVLAGGTAEKMTGKPVGEALVIFADRAEALGFVDAEGESAVRLTACEGSSAVIEEAELALEEHFMERGILSLVVTAEASAREFAEACGVAAADTLDAVADLIAGVSDFFRVRGAEDMDEDALADAYEAFVFDDGFIDAVRDYLTENLSVIENSAKDIAAIADLYFAILGHEDNPALIWKDYWSLKEFYPDGITGELAELMTRMEEALSAYERDYGVTIDGESTLLAAVADYVSLTAEKLAALIGVLSRETLSYSLGLIDAVLDVAGLAGDAVAGLLALPENAAEFVEKAAAAATLSADKLADEFKDAYESVREALTREEYEAFRADVEAEYGSAEEFFESLRR